jgi:hypothetical protein
MGNSTGGTRDHGRRREGERAWASLIYLWLCDACQCHGVRCRAAGPCHGGSAASAHDPFYSLSPRLEQVSRHHDRIPVPASESYVPLSSLWTLPEDPKEVQKKEGMCDSGGSPWRCGEAHTQRLLSTGDVHDWIWLEPCAGTQNAMNFESADITQARIHRTRPRRKQPQSKANSRGNQPLRPTRSHGQQPAEHARPQVRGDDALVLAVVNKADAHARVRGLEHDLVARPAARAAVAPARAAEPADERDARARAARARGRAHRRHGEHGERLRERRGRAERARAERARERAAERAREADVRGAVLDGERELERRAGRVLEGA